MKDGKKQFNLKNILSSISDFFSRVKQFFANKQNRLTAIVISSTIAFFALVLGLALGFAPVKSIQLDGGGIILTGDDMSGQYIIVTRRSGRKERVAVTESMVSNLNTETKGGKKVKITYKDFEAFVPIYVVEDSDVEVVLPTTFTSEYEPNSGFAEGGELWILYGGKCFKRVSITPDMVENFDTSTNGDYLALIKYRTLEHAYPYTVMKVVQSVTPIGIMYAEQGHALNAESLMGNAALNVIYTDGTSETVPLLGNYTSFGDSGTKVPINTENPAEAKDCDLTISYRGTEITLHIRAYPEGHLYNVSSVELVLPKSVYKIGDMVDIASADCYLLATYSYLTGSDRISITDDMIVTPLVFSTREEELDFKVSFAGISVSKKVRVIDESEATEITSMDASWVGPLNVAFGAELSLEGVTLDVVYGYGYSHKKVDLTSDMITGFSSNVEGAGSFNITYSDGVKTKTISKDIIVQSPTAENVTSLTNISGWQNKTYKSSSTLVIPTTAILSVEYGYGASSGDIPLTIDMISGFIPGQVGTQNLTVTYAGKTISLLVYVGDDSVNDISEVAINSISTHYVGQDFDTTKVDVSVYRSGGSEKEDTTLAALILQGATFDTAYKKDEAGVYRVRIYIGDCMTWDYVDVVYAPDVSVLVGIDVQCSDEAKLQYQVGDLLNVNGISIARRYSDGSSDDVAVDASMISKFSTAKRGSYYLTITYQGHIAYLNYVVN